MKDKIKEILEALKPLDEEFAKAGIKEYPLYLKPDQQKILLDYITNLQEENERLNNNWEELEKYINSQKNWWVNSDDKLMEKPFIFIKDLRNKLKKFKLRR